MSEAQKTPAAKWRQEGQADPHGDHYNCQRAALTLGEYTDDELANGVFLHGNEPLNINALLRKTPGYHSAIVWLTAAKDRIRWLSRSLEESAAREQALQLRLNEADQYLDDLKAQLAQLSAIGELIVSQDNRCTDQPLFAVMEKRGIPTLDTHDHDRIEWVETESGDYCLADDTKARRLEALHQGHRDTPGWERYAMKDVDVFVTACFTEQGCKDFLLRDGHNHRRPFIYAFGSYRNGEYQAVRNSLKAMASPAHPAVSGASERCREIPGTSGMRLNMLANQGE